MSVVDARGRERARYKVPYGAVLSIEDGSMVEGGQIVAQWDPHTHPIITEVAGVVHFSDLIDGVTMNRQTDEVTGFEQFCGNRFETARRRRKRFASHDQVS